MSVKASSEDRARLCSDIEEAARVIAPVWPLATFIAVNPLWDLREMPFDDAIAHAGKVLGIRGYPPAELFAEAFASGRVTVADVRAAAEHMESLDSLESCSVAASRVSGATPRPDDDGAAFTVEKRTAASAERHNRVYGPSFATSVDREVAKWCSAYVAGVLPVDPAGGFYTAWQDVIGLDPAARSIFGKAGRGRLADFGADPETAILSSLALAGVPDEERVSELERQFARMPGWAGHAKWWSNWAGAREPGPALHLVDYLAVRLCYEALMPQASGEPGAIDRGSPGGSPRRGVLRWARRDEQRSPAQPSRHGSAGSQRRPADLPSEVRQVLSELPPTEGAKLLLSAFEGHYRDWLLAALDGPAAPPVDCPRAQAIFCIDARSEGLRRHLEALGPYETLGFAGFFALPLRFQPLGSSEAIELCPVLLRPSVELAEGPGGDLGPSPTRELQARQALAAARNAFDSARKGFLAPFILAEAAGFLAGPVAVAKTLAPRRWQALRNRVGRMLAPRADTTIDVGPEAGPMSDEDQASFAATALTMMGLTQGFAPIVLVCGHGSASENNPFESSFDCGACGGNRGGSSARAVAAIMNRAPTRRLLCERGIVVPDGTVFVAGEHDTATDKVRVLDVHLVPASHRMRVMELQADLDRAGADLAEERAVLLPGARRRRGLSLPSERSADWAQVQPEWGLARNAAFIVAPRGVTAEVNLERRCFLHSYDPGVDPYGTALETILTAPMIVAHWINAQYYFSTVDPEALSAGDKTAHNIVAGVGVLQGAGGDLRGGLPIQSVFDAGRAFHEPMRLLVVVQAPRELLERVIGRNRVLQQLFNGQWVHLATREDGLDPWKMWRPGGVWERWEPAERRVGAERWCE